MPSGGQTRFRTDTVPSMEVRCAWRRNEADAVEKDKIATFACVLKTWGLPGMIRS
jgi:hypothetical protein